MNLPAADRNLLCRAAFLLLFIRSGFVFLGYARLRRLLSAMRAPHTISPEELPDEVRRITWAVSVAASILLTEKPCLAIALGTHWLLSRRGVATELRIGLTRTVGEGNLEAHAWVEHDGRILIGQSLSSDSYHRLPTFDPWT